MIKMDTRKGRLSCKSSTFWKELNLSCQTYAPHSVTDEKFLNPSHMQTYEKTIWKKCIKMWINKNWLFCAPASYKTPHIGRWVIGRCCVIYEVSLYNCLKYDRAYFCLRRGSMRHCGVFGWNLICEWLHQPLCIDDGVIEVNFLWA